MPRPTAIVTGGSRGIGRAIALELARTHEVIATYRNRRDAAEALKAESGVEIFGCDVSSRENRAALIAFAQRKFSRLDLLVNNAGMAPKERRDVLDSTEESFDELIATNLKGPHFLTRAAARWMAGTHSERQASAGHIIFITSISAYAVSLNRAEYCISKAGLSMSATLWAQRLVADGIRVFEIRPGLIRTDMIAAVAKNYEERIAAGLIPQRRMGEPADVARAVRAIADGLLDYSTGQVIDVDGGFHLRTV
ncbi:MAG: 3-ketoacyl-ACP reductase [Acidobacteria bacterium]|nr:MAG: 3-ketoacyl-ACP reductase [Acidobacteriota bacterium]